MRNGPVVSEVLDLMNSGRLAGEDDPRWQQRVSDRLNHDVHLEQMPERQYLRRGMIRLGTAFKCSEPDYHRCVAISHPERNGGLVVLVGLTTDDGTWPDRDCILTPADWSELDRPPAVKAQDAAVSVEVLPSVAAQLN